MPRSQMKRSDVFSVTNLINHEKEANIQSKFKKYLS